MPNTLIPLVAALLDAPDAARAKPLVDTLVATLCQITAIDLHPELFRDEHASITAFGKAVSPTTAAQCAEDVERTRVFLQGVHAAVSKRLAALPEDQSLSILYAGTGPFGLLLVPLLPFFDHSRLRVTLLDIHADSLQALQQVLDAFDAGKAVASIVQADACQWQADSTYDLIISETMREGLIQEPQVSVFSHLVQFLAEDGELLPQRIELDLWLSGGDNPMHLGPLFTLERQTATALQRGDLSCLQGSLPVPEYSSTLTDIKLTTYIQVYPGYVLLENQSQLNLPLYERNALPRPGTLLQYRYTLGEDPRWQFGYESLRNQPLPDSDAPGGLGVFHLARFWHKAQAQKRSQPLPEGLDTATEWQLERMLMDVLALGLEPTLERVYASHSLAEFERWVLDTNPDVASAEYRQAINQRLRQWAEGARVSPAAGFIDGPLNAEQLQHWETHGYIVVPGILSEAQCTQAREAIWSFLEMREDEPASWYKSSSAMKKVMVQLFNHPALDAARSSQRLQAIFKQLWQCDDLVISTDRVGFNPPETDHWRFPGPAMHWDVELKSPIPFATQALIYLCDVAEHQGAFSCVPGFHHNINHWLEQLPPDTDPQDQDWSQWAVKPIAARAGDLIIWHQALPHGASPNRARYPRFVQYINMYR